MSDSKGSPEIKQNSDKKEVAFEDLFSQLWRHRVLFVSVFVVVVGSLVYYINSTTPQFRVESRVDSYDREELQALNVPLAYKGPILLTKLTKMMNSPEFREEVKKDSVILSQLDSEKKKQLFGTYLRQLQVKKMGDEYATVNAISEEANLSAGWTARVIELGNAATIKKLQVTHTKKIAATKAYVEREKEFYKQRREFIYKKQIETFANLPQSVRSKAMFLPVLYNPSEFGELDTFKQLYDLKPEVITFDSVVKVTKAPVVSEAPIGPRGLFLYVYILIAGLIVGMLAVLGRVYLGEFKQVVQTVIDSKKPIGATNS